MVVNIIVILLISGVSSISFDLPGTIFTSSLQVTNGISCPDPWTAENCLHNNGGFLRGTRTCYLPVQVKKNWIEALDYCRSIGDDLASIHDEDTNKILSELTGVDDHWIGGKRDKGIWSWSDGSPWDYENWGPGEGHDDTYAEMVKGGGWEDEDNHTQHFICQQTALRVLLSRDEKCLFFNGLDSVNATGEWHNPDYIFTSIGLSEKINPNMMGRYSLVKTCNLILIYKHDTADYYLSNVDNAWVVGTETETLLRRPMSTWSWWVPGDGWSHKIGDVWTFDHTIQVTSVKNCEWGEWSPDQNCSKPCGSGVWRLRRQVVSPDPYCSLDSYGPECWRVEHCNDHSCPSTLATWVLAPMVTLLVTLLLAGMAMFLYKRGYTRLQRGIPLRTYPAISGK